MLSTNPIIIFTGKPTLATQVGSEQEQLDVFIENNRYDLEVTEEQLQDKTLRLKQTLQQQNTTQDEKIIAMVNFGQELLVIKILLFFKNNRSIPTAHCNKLQENLNKLQLISTIEIDNAMVTKIIESIEIKEILEYMVIAALDIAEYWLIGAIADLGFKLEQNSGMEQAVAIKAFIDHAVFNDLAKLPLLISGVKPHGITATTIQKRQASLQAASGRRKLD